MTSRKPVEFYDAGHFVAYSPTGKTLEPLRLRQPDPGE